MKNKNMSSEKGRVIGQVLTIMVVLCLMCFHTNSMAAPTSQEAPPFETIPIPPEVHLWNPDSNVVDARSSKNPKLDSSMAGLADAEDTAEQNALITSQSLKMSGGLVQVQIVIPADGLQAAITVVNEAGGEVTKTSMDGTLIQGWLPIDKLEDVAAHDEVFFIRRPAEAVPLENEQVGSNTTEGLAAMNGAAWHSAGYLGTGVKVGIIDLGFLDYPNLLGGDLPSTVSVKNFVDGESDMQVNATTVHGTACAEVVNDVAPEAMLYFAKVSTNLDLAQAVTWMKDTNHVDIISTSLGWYNITPGDGNGEFADLVQFAQSAGILWVTSAGNDREAHWGGPYHDPYDQGYHFFNEGEFVNYYGPGNNLAYLIPSGNSIRVYLRWDDWTNVNQDYDLYLYRFNLIVQDWVQVAASENNQNGSPGQKPTEEIFYTTTGAAASYGFAIKKVYGFGGNHLEVFAPKIARLKFINHDRSLNNLADATNAMTVAALDVNSPWPQESYSSQGPTNGPGGTATGGFGKPDISAFANVSTVSYGILEKFNGTSAATPHVAGAAALVLDAYPASTPDELWVSLKFDAIDMGPFGADNIYGHGRLHLDAPRICPMAGIWSGTTSQGLPIEFEVENLPECSVAAESIRATINCGGTVATHTLAVGLLISDHHFDNGTGVLGTFVAGDFTSSERAHGTITYRTKPLCEMTGTWSALFTHEIVNYHIFLPLINR